MSGNHEKDQESYLGIGIALGVAIGTAFGIALGNLALGIGCGIAIGVAIGLALFEKNKSSDAEKEPDAKVSKNASDAQ